MAFIPGPLEIPVTHVVIDPVNTLEKADALAHDLPSDRRGANFECIASAELDRVESKFLSQDVHIAFGREAALRDTEAAECTGGYVVGVRGEAVDAHVRYVVRAGCMGGRPCEYFLAKAGVGAAVTVERGFDGRQLAIPGCPCAHPDKCCVAFGVHEQALLPRVQHLDGFLRRLGKQRDVYLPSNVFLAAEAASHECRHDANVIGVHAKCRRGLIAVRVWNLACNVNRGLTVRRSFATFSQCIANTAEASRVVACRYAD